VRIGQQDVPVTRRILSAATLSGYLVRSPGDDVGCIEDLMIWTQSGSLQYAIVSLVGFPGTSNKLSPIPWRALDLNHEQRVFVLSVERAKLDNAPAFDEHQWPDFSDSSWSDEVHRHFGLQEAA
jgi:hypothetical protein